MWLVSRTQLNLTDKFFFFLSKSHTAVMEWHSLSVEIEKWTCLEIFAQTPGVFPLAMLFSKTHSWAWANMSLSSIPAHSTETSTVLELPIDAFIATLSLKKANAPAAAIKECDPCLLPSTDERSKPNPIWLWTAPRLNKTAAFSVDTPKKNREGSVELYDKMTIVRA